MDFHLRFFLMDLLNSLRLTNIECLISSKGAILTFCLLQLNRHLQKNSCPGLAIRKINIYVLMSDSHLLKKIMLFASLKVLMKLGELIEYNKKNIFISKVIRTIRQRLVPGLFIFYLKMFIIVC